MFLLAKILVSGRKNKGNEVFFKRLKYNDIEL